jgi:hypothetical protein
MAVVVYSVPAVSIARFVSDKEKQPAILYILGTFSDLSSF